MWQQPAGWLTNPHPFEMEADMPRIHVHYPTDELVETLSTILFTAEEYAIVTEIEQTWNACVDGTPDTVRAGAAHIAARLRELHDEHLAAYHEQAPLMLICANRITAALNV